MSLRNAARPLRIASCMAPSADEMCRAIARHLQARLGIAVEMVDDVPWRERELMFDAGEIDLCWICGLPYVQKADQCRAIEPCVAPVMHARRYEGRPVYFSDVVVRSDSPYVSFEDLQDRIWVYNEPRSHSGFGVVCHHLATQGLTLDYFAHVVEAGAHHLAMELILSGQAAAGAIDSTVLETELRRRPRLAGELRSVATLGPSPAPPWIFSAHVPSPLRRSVSRCLAEMHRDCAGAAALAQWGVAELRQVDDRSYDAIRTMAASAAQARGRRVG